MVYAKSMGYKLIGKSPVKKAAKKKKTMTNREKINPMVGALIRGK